jgi:uncharacterized Zn finger protein
VAASSVLSGVAVLLLLVGCTSVADQRAALREQVGQDVRATLSDLQDRLLATRPRDSAMLRQQLELTSSPGVTQVRRTGAVSALHGWVALDFIRRDYTKEPFNTGDQLEERQCWRFEATRSYVESDAWRVTPVEVQCTDLDVK